MQKPTGRPVGYRESEETKAKKSAAMKDRLAQKNTPRVEWATREGWKPWGDRLNFLSPERAHLETGKLTILPARKRD